MAERTTSAEDTQNQQCQCVHTNVDSFLKLLLVLGSVNMAGVYTPPCFGDSIPKHEPTTSKYRSIPPQKLPETIINTEYPLPPAQLGQYESWMNCFVTRDLTCVSPT